MTRPPLVPIKSSMASHAHYDSVRQELHVKFHNGDTFAYDVPADKGEVLMGARSFGEAFNKLVAGRHPGRKV